MDNTKSAKKALRVGKRKWKINLARTRKIKSVVSKIKKSNVKDSTKQERLALMKNLQSQLDRATKSGFMHKNKASRLKKRFAKKLK